MVVTVRSALETYMLNAVNRRQHTVTFQPEMDVEFGLHAADMTTRAITTQHTITTLDRALLKATAVAEAIQRALIYANSGSSPWRRYW